MDRGKWSWHYPPPCWSHRAQAVATLSCSLAGAGTLEWSRHSPTPSLTSARAHEQHTLLLHCWNPRACTVKTFFCRLLEAREGALLPTLYSCLAKASGCMWFTQGTVDWLIDWLIDWFLLYSPHILDVLYNNINMNQTDAWALFTI